MKKDGIIGRLPWSAKKGILADVKHILPSANSLYGQPIKRQKDKKTKRQKKLTNKERTN